MILEIIDCQRKGCSSMKKILFIDNDIAAVQQIQHYLEENGDFSIDIVSHGTIGMEKALTSAYDLILLSLVLPGTDGFTICQTLRKYLDIPIIIFSPKKEDADMASAFASGATDFISQPVSFVELTARIKAHIASYEQLTAKTKEQSRSVVTSGDVKIYPEQRRVFIKGKEIYLKNKEFELFLFLVSHENVVFSKETLYSKIWGDQAIGVNATVPVHINRIREKIEENPSKPVYLQTMWGVGYHFNSGDS